MDVLLFGSRHQYDFPVRRAVLKFIDLLTIGLKTLSLCYRVSGTAMAVVANVHLQLADQWRNIVLDASFVVFCPAECISAFPRWASSAFVDLKPSGIYHPKTSFLAAKEQFTGALPSPLKTVYEHG